MWDLFSRSGIKPGPPVLGTWSLNPGTTREVLVPYFLLYFSMRQEGGPTVLKGAPYFLPWSTSALAK